MQELVKIIKNEPFTNSLVIAEGTGNQHESVVRLIKEQLKRIEKFGTIDFSDLKSGKRGRPIKVYKLNEPQATLLITFMDNTDLVADFKTELVHQFYQMRQFIWERQTKEWTQQRNQGKLIRNAETDTIKKLVEYAKEQGSTHADMLYMTYSKLANKMAGISNRDLATCQQLNELSFVEHIILNQILIGMDQGLPYKEIYKLCKARIEQFREVAYLTAVVKELEKRKIPGN